MAPRWSLDGSTMAFPSEEESSCSSSIVSGLSSSDVLQQQERTDDKEREDGDENSLSTSISSTQHPKKNVVFQDLVTVFVYETIMIQNSDVVVTDDGDGYSGWYSIEDLRRFKMDVVRTVEHILSGETYGGGGDNDFCSRGCEYRTPMGTVLRQKHRRDGLESVLGYQYEQQRRGKVVDPDQLGKIYAAVARHSQTVANVMGNIDQSVVMDGPSSPSSVPPPPSTVSPSFASYIDPSISNRVSHGAVQSIDCSNNILESEQPLHPPLQQKNCRIEVLDIPSPPAFAFRRHHHF
jgi:hypothetical protein